MGSRGYGADDAAADGEAESGAFFFVVGGAQLAIDVALILETTLSLGLALLVLLAIAAKPRERHRLHPFLANLESARLAHAVTALVQPLECVIDLFDFRAAAVGEDEIDLAVALLGGEVIGVHALVLVALTLGLELRLHLAEQLGLHIGQVLADLGEKPLAAGRAGFGAGRLLVGGRFGRHRSLSPSSQFSAPVIVPCRS